jgi:hypothetical protein
MSLNPLSVDLKAPGVQPNTEDFPLAWIRRYGDGRVFYSALGHFDETWRDRRFQQMLEGALLWMTKIVDAPAEPRPTGPPLIAAAGNAATGKPERTVSPGALISIFGRQLTPGGSIAGPYLNRLAGTTVHLNGVPLTLLYSGPGQINAQVPRDLAADTGQVVVSTPSGRSNTFPVTVAPATPGVFAATTTSQAVTLWATGLGASPVLTATIAGQPARILFAGPSPEFPGLDQINLEIPAGTPRGARQVEVSLASAPPFYAAQVQLP